MIPPAPGRTQKSGARTHKGARRRVQHATDFFEQPHRTFGLARNQNPAPESEKNRLIFRATFRTAPSRPCRWRK
jgi:hypothetical protein